MDAALLKCLCFHCKQAPLEAANNKCGHLYCVQCYNGCKLCRERSRKKPIGKSDCKTKVAKKMADIILSYKRYDIDKKCNYVFMKNKCKDDTTHQSPISRENLSLLQISRLPSTQNNIASQQSNHEEHTVSSETVPSDQNNIASQQSNHEEHTVSSETVPSDQNNLSESAETLGDLPVVLDKFEALAVSNRPLPQDDVFPVPDDVSSDLTVNRQSPLIAASVAVAPTSSTVDLNDSLGRLVATKETGVQVDGSHLFVGFNNIASSESLVILPTGSPSEASLAIGLLKRFKMQFGCKVEQQYTPSITHVVSLSELEYPTAEIYYGFGIECKIVRSEWMQACIDNHCIVPENYYLIFKKDSNVLNAFCKDIFRNWCLKVHDSDPQVAERLEAIAGVFGAKTVHGFEYCEKDHFVVAVNPPKIDLERFQIATIAAGLLSSPHLITFGFIANCLRNYRVLPFLPECGYICPPSVVFQWKKAENLEDVEDNLSISSEDEVGFVVD